MMQVVRNVMLSPSVGLRMNSAKHLLFLQPTEKQILRLRLKDDNLRPL